MTNARVHPVPKEFLRLPGGFQDDGTGKRAVESIVTVFGRNPRRPLRQDERVRGLDADEEGRTKTSVGSQDVL